MAVFGALREGLVEIKQQKKACIEQKEGENGGEDMESRCESMLADE